jgi:hypothetical protein
MCQTSSANLRNYGIPSGLTNVPAAFLAGFLIARQFLTKFGLSKTPYAYSLDPGSRLPTALRMRAIVIGASIGGLFPVDEPITPELMEVLEGKLIADYMRLLSDDPDRYNRQFSRFAALGIDADGVCPMYRHAFAAISAAFPVLE